jgi:hypothetical protein
MTCTDCGAELVATSESFVSCPNGHGRLIHHKSAPRLWRQQLGLRVAIDDLEGLPIAERTGFKTKTGRWLNAEWRIEGKAASPCGPHRSARSAYDVRNASPVREGRAVAAVIPVGTVGNSLPRVAMFELLDS